MSNKQSVKTDQACFQHQPDPILLSPQLHHHIHHHRNPYYLDQFLMQIHLHHLARRYLYLGY